MLTRTAPTPSLATMTLLDAPDFATAIAAAEARGIEPPKALRSAFGKWVTENADLIQRYGIANLYDGDEAGRAMVNTTALLHLLTVVVADTRAQAARTEERLAAIEARQLNP